MSFNNIKAPEYLKNKTINLMQAQQNGSIKRKLIKIPLILASTACIVMLCIITVLGYNIFSGINSDEITLNAEYKGNGIVEIKVENLANKDLQFDKTIKLEQWSTNKEILEITKDIPTIKSGESTVIKINIPDEYIDILEEPLAETDWYDVLFTTNNFMSGQSWTASMIFTQPVNTNNEVPVVPNLPIEDNTNKDDVDIIKSNFKYQFPLKNFNITYDYNDYIVDSEYVHPEIDLAGERGDEILPFADGTVIKAELDYEMGWYMIIDHGNGLKTRYTHCNELLKKQGDTVTMNDVIAFVGNTGMSTGPHLGFNITMNDVPINPNSIFIE